MTKNNERLQDLRLSKVEAMKLLQQCTGEVETAQKIMFVLGALGSSPAGAYASIDDIAETPLPYPLILALRDIFLARVNRGLQDIYRDGLLAQALPLGLQHQQRLDLLLPLRPQAIAHISRFDWNWLANWLRLDSVGETIASSLNRLSNLAFACDTVNLRFTLHCNIQCRHCYNHSGPRAKKQTAVLAELLAIVAQMPAAGLRRLSISGGEPFLYQDHVMSLIQAGRRAGLKQISINTNGFWADTAAHADQVLERMRNAGFMCDALDKLKLSVGPYHQEFIPLATPLILAERFYRMFARKITLDVELANEEPSFTDQLRAALAVSGLEKRVRLRFRHVTPMGRGQNISVDRPLIFGDKPCKEINTIVFEADGTARACCGMNAQNQGLVIGLAGDALTDIVKRMQNDPLLQYMANQPLKHIFSLVGVTPRTGGYYDKCELCQDAVGSLRNKETIQEKLFAEQAYYPFWFRQSDLLP